MIEIITDSTCDIPAELVARYPIQVLPYLVIWNGKSYRDRIELTPAEFYTRLRTETNLPTTAFSGVEAFQQAYQAAYARGASSAIVITIASNLSGAAGIARQAAEHSPLPVHVHESGGTTMGVGWQVLAAARASQQGASVGEILAEASRVRERICAMAYLETLEYAYRGGRLSRVSWMVGAALNIKGVIEIDHKHGQVALIGRAHGHSRGVDLLFERFFDRLGPAERQHVAVLHGGAPEEGFKLMERVRSQINPLELFLDSTGPILGTHTGPGALALVGYTA